MSSVDNSRARAAAVARMQQELRHREKLDLAAMARLSSEVPPAWTPGVVASLASEVDHSPYLRFIREQGGYGCTYCARSACWDIMNEKACPYSPTMSVNRQLWVWARVALHHEGVEAAGVNYTLSRKDYFVGYGCPTEGTELTNSDAVQWPTVEGDREAPNYRIAGPATPINVNVKDLKVNLAKTPVSIVVYDGAHSVALVGYSDKTQKLKFVDNYGDQSGEGGFGYISYADVPQAIQGAERVEFVPPRSVPTAVVRFNHSCRQDVHLWIGIEGRPSARLIWPSGQLQDVSRNLNFCVTLPRGFAWPPAQGNRLFLQVFDAGGRYQSGGDLVEFTAAFCGQTVPCSQLAQGPAHFSPYQTVRFYIP